MARIVGITIPDDKRLEIALTYVFGIGNKTSNKILEKLKINKNIRLKDLPEEDLNRIRVELEKNYVVESDLKRKLSMNIKRLQEIGCYRGLRHRLGMPVRGQTTKRNARTRKGPKKTVANKKK